MPNETGIRLSICDHGHDREYLQVAAGHERRLDGRAAHFTARAWVPESDLDDGLYCNRCVHVALVRGQSIVALDEAEAAREIGELIHQRPQPRGSSDMAAVTAAVNSRHDAVGHQHAAAQSPGTVRMPTHLAGPIFDALGARFPAGLYPTQIDALEAAHAGRDVIQVTSTASGKTVGLLYPALVAASEGKNVLIVTPRNVLHEQYLNEFRTAATQWTEVGDGLIEFQFGPATIRVGVLNGGVRGTDRDAIRRTAQIVITNEYMFETELLGWNRHTDKVRNDKRWRRFLTNTSLVVFDELDCKLGHERSTTMWTLRAMVAYITELSARPQVLMASATITDPHGFHTLYTGGDAPVTVVDGASSSQARDLILIQPETGRSVIDSAIDVVVDATRANGGLAPMTAVFVQTPGEAATVERLLAAELVRHGFADQASTIAVYTGPTERNRRREVENGINRFQTRITVATEAFGIGTDLGPLEFCVLAGCPQTAGKALQWMGRAGRRSRSLSVIVLDQSPLAEVLAASPEPLDALREAAASTSLPIVTNHIEKFFVRPLIGCFGHVSSAAVKSLSSGAVADIVTTDSGYQIVEGRIVPTGECPPAASMITHSSSYEALTRDGHRYRLGLLHGAGRYVPGAELVLDGRWFRVSKTSREKRFGDNSSQVVHILHVAEIERDSGWTCKFDYRLDDATENRSVTHNGMAAKFAAGQVRLNFFTTSGPAPSLTFGDAGVVELSLPAKLATTTSLAQLVQRTAFALGIPTFDIYVEEITPSCVLILDKHVTGRMSWVIADAILSAAPGGRATKNRKAA